MFKFLTGSRTYILGIAGALVSALQTAGVIDLDPAKLESLLGALLSLGLVTLRAGVKKAESAADPLNGVK